jgi:RNA polymerase sigma-70 factor (ECF subfamily)
MGGRRGKSKGGPTIVTSDEELVARSRGGDLDSFNQLVLRWERPIYALAYRVIGREEDARDVAQETFLRAFRALGGFKGQAKFSSWLYRITLNLCRDWIRRERRTPIAQPPEGVDLVELAGESTPTESLEVLDCPLSTVKTRLYQGLTVLRRQLESAGVESAFGPERPRGVVQRFSPRAGSHAD